MVALSHEMLLIRELTEHAERTCGVGDMNGCSRSSGLPEGLGRGFMLVSADCKEAWVRVGN